MQYIRRPRRDIRTFGSKLAVLSSLKDKRKAEASRNFTNFMEIKTKILMLLNERKCFPEARPSPSDTGEFLYQSWYKNTQEVISFILFSSLDYRLMKVETTLFIIVFLAPSPGAHAWQTLNQHFLTPDLTLSKPDQHGHVIHIWLSFDNM